MDVTDIIWVEAKWFFKHSFEMFCPFSWVICLSLPDVPVVLLSLWLASEPEVPYRQRQRTIILCANSCLVMLEVDAVMMGRVSSRSLQLDLKKSRGSLVCSMKNLCGRYHFLGLPQQSTTNWVVRRGEIYFLTVLETRSLRSKVFAGLVSSEASLAGWLADGCLLSLSCPHIVFPLCLPVS